MSETAQKLFDGLRALKDGVQAGMQKGMAEVGAEAGRLGTQGSMELASALFNGHAFVPYGPGQYTPDVEQQPTQDLDRGLER